MKEMSTTYTSSQIRTIPNVVVSNNSTVLSNAIIGNNLSVSGDIEGANIIKGETIKGETLIATGDITGTNITASSITLRNPAEGKSEDLEDRLQAIENDLDNEDLHTTTAEAKALAAQIKELIVEGELDKVIGIVDEIDEIKLDTDSLRDISDKINGTEGTLASSTLKSYLESSINQAKYRIDDLDGQINGIDGSETTQSALKSEIESRITQEVITINNTINNTIGEYKADDDTTVYGKMYDINKSLTDAYKSADGSLTERIDELVKNIGEKATSDESGTVVTHATGIFKVIDDYKSSIDKLTNVVEKYQSHVDTYTDVYINDLIVGVVGNEGTENDSASGIYAKLEELENKLSAYEGGFVNVVDSDVANTKSFEVIKGAMYTILSNNACTVYLNENGDDIQIGTVEAQEQRCLMATENGTFTIITDATDTDTWEVSVYQTKLLN